MSKTPFPMQPELTAIALAFQNKNLVAERVLPSVPVGTQSFKYLRHDLSQGITIPDTKVGRLSAPNRVEFSATEASDSCYDFGLDDVIPFADIENRPPNYDPVAVATEGLTALIELDREVRVSTKVLDAANYAAANKATLAGVTQWSDFTNSNPVDAMLVAFEGLIIRPNCVVMGRQVYTKLRQHPKVLAAVFPGGSNAVSGGVASRQAIEDLLECEIIVGESFVNTAKKGQTANRTFVWGKKALAFYRAPNLMNTRTLTLGVSATWGGRIAGSMPEPDAGIRGGTKVRVGESRSETLCAAEVGFLWTDAIA